MDKSAWSYISMDEFYQIYGDETMAEDVVHEVKKVTEQLQAKLISEQFARQG